MFLEREELIQVKMKGSINPARQTEAQISGKKATRRKARERGVKKVLLENIGNDGASWLLSLSYGLEGAPVEDMLIESKHLNRKGVHSCTVEVPENLPETEGSWLAYNKLLSMDRIRLYRTHSNEPAC